MSRGKPSRPAAAPPTGARLARTFVLRFVLAFAVLEAFVLLVLYHSPWFAPYAAANAQLSAWLLGPFLEGVRATEGYLIAPTFSLSVRPGCDSYQASAVLLAGIVAFPAPAARKWIGGLVGVTCLQLLNLFRLAVLLWTGVHHRVHFDLMHLEILPVVFVAVALGLLFGWALWARK